MAQKKKKEKKHKKGVWKNKNQSKGRGIKIIKPVKVYAWKGFTLFCFFFYYFSFSPFRVIILWWILVIPRSPFKGRVWAVPPEERIREIQGKTKQNKTLSKAATIRYGLVLWYVGPNEKCLPGN